MSKIDIVTINTDRTWVNLESKNIKQISICNTSASVTSYVDFALGPASLKGQANSDTGAAYYLNNVAVPMGSTLVLDEEWLYNSFSAGQTLFVNSISQGSLTRTEIVKPIFLIRLGNNQNEAVDLIILRR
tara:strand:- start:362 stop:751 length:390 start_codon:yes stop_codon:yes gene_type:complete